MLGLIIRFIWRLIVLALVLALAYVTSVYIFPYLDKRLPIFIVSALIYVFIAYFGLPLIIRFSQLVIKPHHIPRYAVTSDGWPSDPVNLVIIAKNRRHLSRSFEAIGWYKADKLNFLNCFRGVMAMVLDWPYFKAPFSSLYLFGRKFDVGFQLPYGKTLSPRKRHHVRFWQLDKSLPDEAGHVGYWLDKLKKFLHLRQTVWIGAAVDDYSISGINWRNLQLTHAVRHDHLSERDLIIKQLKDAGLIKKLDSIDAGEPFELRGQQLRGKFKVGRQLKIIILK